MKADARQVVAAIVRGRHPTCETTGFTPAAWFQVAADGRVIHTVWGMPKGAERPAVLITVYVPDRTRRDASSKVRAS